MFETKVNPYFRKLTIELLFTTPQLNIAQRPWRGTSHSHLSLLSPGQLMFFTSLTFSQTAPITSVPPPSSCFAVTLLSLSVLASTFRCHDRFRIAGRGLGDSLLTKRILERLITIPVVSVADPLSSMLSETPLGVGDLARLRLWCFVRNKERPRLSFFSLSARPISAIFGISFSVFDTAVFWCTRASAADDLATVLLLSFLPINIPVNKNCGNTSAVTRCTKADGPFRRSTITDVVATSFVPVTLPLSRMTPPSLSPDRRDVVTVRVCVERTNNLTYMLFVAAKVLLALPSLWSERRCKWRSKKRSDLDLGPAVLSQCWVRKREFRWHVLWVSSWSVSICCEHPLEVWIVVETPDVEVLKDLGVRTECDKSATSVLLLAAATALSGFVALSERDVKVCRILVGVYGRIGGKASDRSNRPVCVVGLLSFILLLQSLLSVFSVLLLLSFSSLLSILCLL